MTLTFHANGKIDGINNANFNSSLPTGHVIQVQYVESDTKMSNQSSSSLVDITGLSVSITPQSSSSKLFIIMNINVLTIRGRRMGSYEKVDV